MKIALALIFLVVLSVVFHLFSPWYLTPIASNWTAIDDTISLTFWVTGLVFIAINLFLAYVMNPKTSALNLSLRQSPPSVLPPC